MGFVSDNLKDLEAEFPNCMSNVYCGAGCGDGWKGILRKVLTVFEVTGVKVSQIKEKFGGLRLNWDRPEEWQSPWHRIAVSMAERQAEDASFKICETCGEPGSKKVHGGWMVTECDACFDKYKR